MSNSSLSRDMFHSSSSFLVMMNQWTRFICSSVNTTATPLLFGYLHNTWEISLSVFVIHLSKHPAHEREREREEEKLIVSAITVKVNVWRWSYSLWHSNRSIVTFNRFELLIVFFTHFRYFQHIPLPFTFLYACCCSSSEVKINTWQTAIYLLFLLVLSQSFLNFPSIEISVSLIVKKKKTISKVDLILKRMILTHLYIYIFAVVTIRCRRGKNESEGEREHFSFSFFFFHDRDIADFICTCTLRISFFPFSFLNK